MDETLFQFAQDLGIVHLRRSPSVGGRSVVGRSQEERPGDKEYSHDDGGAHVEDIAGASMVGASRVKSHTVSIVDVRCDPTALCSCYWPFSGRPVPALHRFPGQTTGRQIPLW
jgi:hypothetical protein